MLNVVESLTLKNKGMLGVSMSILNSNDTSHQVITLREIPNCTLPPKGRNP